MGSSDTPLTPVRTPRGAKLYCIRKSLDQIEYQVRMIRIWMNNLDELKEGDDGEK